MKKLSIVLIALMATLVARSELMDRASGIKIGQRMTLKPYVSFYYTYNSNVDQSRKDQDTSSFTINPRLTLTYLGENWNLSLDAFYEYRAYTDYGDALDGDSYGETGTYTWSKTDADGKGWSLMLSEQYRHVCQDDNMRYDEGRGIWRDRHQFNFAGGLNRHYNEKFTYGINASYYLMDYDNDPGKYAQLYGWTRWQVGAEASYAFSKYAKFILCGSYQKYSQDNHINKSEVLYAGMRPTHVDEISDGSWGWTIHAGLGSALTERINYRATVGYSYFEYGGVDDCGTVTYAVNGRWEMTERWNMMVAANRYYMPSEREYGASVNADNLSWGIGHSMIHGKLNATLDLTFRYETHPYTTYQVDDYDEIVWTGRFGLNYHLNRFLSVFGNVGYQDEHISGGGASMGGQFEYDRWFISLGLTLQY